MELLSVKLKVPEECKPHWAPPEIWCYFFFFSFVYRGRHNVYFVRRLSAGGHRKSNLQRLKHYREAVSNNNKFREKASSEHRVPGLPCVAGTRGCAVPGITSRCNHVQKQYINTQTKAASILCFFFSFWEWRLLSQNHIHTATLQASNWPHCVPVCATPNTGNREGP